MRIGIGRKIKVQQVLLNGIVGVRNIAVKNGSLWKKLLHGRGVLCGRIKQDKEGQQQTEGKASRSFHTGKYCLNVKHLPAARAFFRRKIDRFCNSNAGSNPNIFLRIQLRLNDSFTLSGAAFAGKGHISMQNISILLLLISLSSFSCNTTLPGLFDKKTPHEEYAEKLDDRGLDETPEGRAWLAASTAALSSPVQVSLPYRQQGFFQPDKPRAMALQFSAKAGEQLNFTLTRKSGSTLPVYADLFRQGERSSPILSVDTSRTTFSFEVAETGDYLLRLQPELFRTGEYSLSVSVSPSLGFPVSGKKASIGSFWGDDRDGGKRRHEGIDIFAPKLTPAVAAARGKGLHPLLCSPRSATGAGRAAGKER